jgi:ubiquinone/menaquinone biosynthesis C-methylase UbiE
MSDPAAQFVGSIPENYDTELGPRIFFDYADDLSTRVTGRNPQTVLELAAGTGILTRRLRDGLSTDAELVVSDLNPPMLEVAKTKFQAKERVQFKQLDATEIDFPDARFDVVTCQFGVMFFPDKDQSYSEVHRVLKPGGSYIFNVWESWDENPFARVANAAAEKFFPDNPPTFYKVPFSYHDEDEIRESLAHAGFTSVNFVHLPRRSKIPSAARFAHGLVYGNPLYDEVINRGGNPEEVHAAITKAIEQELGEEMPLEALVIEASRD